jgi:hypothetical protein
VEGEEGIPRLVPAAGREEAGVHAAVSSRSSARWEEKMDLPWRRLLWEETARNSRLMRDCISIRIES